MNRTQILEKLAKDVAEAKAYGNSLSAGRDVGGSCNFDTATITKLPIRLKDEEAREIGLSPFTWMGSKAWWASTQGHQGSDSTRCAEGCCKRLKELGYQATMYYQVD